MHSRFMSRPAGGVGLSILAGILFLIIGFGGAVAQVDDPLVINEVLADPASDWDGDGTVDFKGDEWIEVLNNGTEPINLSDYFLRDDLGRLAALLKRNCQDALLSGQHLGIQVGDGGYDVFRHDGNNWVNIKSDSVIYRHWDWSGDWQMDLEFQGRDAQINGGEDTPQLICLASGELLPFSLVLSEGISHSLVLSGRTNGHVEIETRR